MIHRTLCNVGMKSYKFNASSGKVKHCFNNLAEKKFEDLIETIKNTKDISDEVKQKAIEIVKEEQKFRKEHFKDNIVYYNGKFEEPSLKVNHWNEIEEKILKHKLKVGEHNMFPVREFDSTGYANPEATPETRKKMAKDFVLLQINYWKMRGVKILFIVGHLNEDGAKNGKFHSHLAIENWDDDKWGWKLGFMKKKDLKQLQRDYEEYIFKPMAKKYPNDFLYIDIDSKGKLKDKPKRKEDIWDIKFKKIIDEASQDEKNQLINELITELKEKNDLIENLTKSENSKHIIKKPINKIKGMKNE